MLSLNLDSLSYFLGGQLVNKGGRSEQKLGEELPGADRRVFLKLINFKNWGDIHIVRRILSCEPHWWHWSLFKGLTLIKRQNENLDDWGFLWLFQIARFPLMSNKACFYEIKWRYNTQCFYIYRYLHSFIHSGTYHVLGTFPGPRDRVEKKPKFLFLRGL